ncbi:MAG: acyloxyacyl hydrolase [Bacteroidaceae bacterium]|nr:acyloxyacyl hydrolase [Bacteroidaceae bacterium]
MRRIFSLLAVVLFTTLASAQDNQTGVFGENKFAIKVEPFQGSYTSHSYHFEKFRPFSPSGINLGLELPSSQQRPWQQYLGNPTWGVGLSVIDFGHAMMGEAVSMYPYLLIPAVRSKYLDVNFKVAAGLGVVTEHWYTGDVDPDNYKYYSPDVNTIFGCYLNAYLSAALNVSVPITKNVALNGEAGYFHMSNGRTCMPNIGADILFAGVGVITTFNAEAKKEPIQFPDLPYKWTLNITGAAGAHRAWMYYPRYLISSFHAGAVYSVTNWYGLGLGMDVFYNGAIDKGTGRSLYRQDRDYTTMDKVRAGLALNNEFRFGVVTGMVDWGVYFFNPSRNYYDTDHPIYGYGKRPLFYKNDGAGTDEAFHYIRFGMKYRIWDNLYLQTSAKTHLHICEYVEFGLGYQIPFLKKGLRKGDSNIFHHTKNWWK